MSNRPTAWSAPSPPLLALLLVALVSTIYLAHREGGAWGIAAHVGLAIAGVASACTVGRGKPALVGAGVVLLLVVVVVVRAVMQQHWKHETGLLALAVGLAVGMATSRGVPADNTSGRRGGREFLSWLASLVLAPCSLAYALVPDVSESTFVRTVVLALVSSVIAAAMLVDRRTLHRRRTWGAVALVLLVPAMSALGLWTTSYRVAAILLVALSWLVWRMGRTEPCNRA